MLEQMEPVMVEVQRPSREEPRVEGRMVKVDFFLDIWTFLKYLLIIFEVLVGQGGQSGL